MCVWGGGGRERCKVGVRWGGVGLRCVVVGWGGERRGGVRWAVGPGGWRLVVGRSLAHSVEFRGLAWVGVGLVVSRRVRGTMGVIRPSEDRSATRHPPEGPRFSRFWCHEDDGSRRHDR